MENAKLKFNRKDNVIREILGAGKNLDILSQAIQSMITDLEAKKQALLKEKFLEKVGFSIDDESLKDRKFAKIMVQNGEEKYDGQYLKVEKWYYDNGTKEGLLIIKFIESPTPMNMNNGSFNMYIELLYE